MTVEKYWTSWEVVDLGLSLQVHRIDGFSALRSQKAVIANLKSKQLKSKQVLPFGFLRQ